MSRPSKHSGGRRIDTYIPHPSITSFNINSLSYHAQGEIGAKRRHRKINYLDRLLRDCDILCMQEPKLGANDKGALQVHFPHHHIYYNNDRLDHGGTMILVSHRYAKHYNIEELDTTAAPRGRLQALRFHSLTHPDISKASFDVFNTYLPADGNATAKLDILTLISPIHNMNHNSSSHRGHLFLSGDFNFTTDPNDTSNPNSTIRLRSRDLDRWANITDQLGLREVEQSTHSHFALTNTTANTRSSRIDRQYNSLTDAELTVISCVAEISLAGAATSRGASLTSDFLQDDPSTGLKAAYKRTHVSDHLPITTRFYSLSPTSSRSFNAPSYLGDDKSLALHTKAHWTGYVSGGKVSPFAALADWKGATKASVITHFSESKGRKAKLQAGVAELTAAIALLRACTRGNQDTDHIDKLLRTHTNLNQFINTSTTRYTITGLIEFIDNLFYTSPIDAAQALQGKDGGEEIEIDLPPSFVPGTGRKGCDPISAIKERLPCTRARLSALRAKPGDALTSDPQMMGDIIVGHYSKVWARNKEGARSPAIYTYIQQVAGKMQIPTHLQPTPTTADDFIDIINDTNDSCAGPDGIPFSYYRTYIQLDRALAEVLADICSLLAAGHLPPLGYNHARFFLIPKKEGGLIADTRGISVSNADNRLMATGLVRAITPALQAIIHKDQKGFVPGRVGTEHAHALTNSFYSALSRKQQRYILLLDTKRAFDTVSHTFIHSALASMGFTGWFCRAVAGLLHDVVVIPVLSTTTKHRIRIERGVKQGCPLSPLLFIICFDILLHQLDGARSSA
jgi:exonuclease III